MKHILLSTRHRLLLIALFVSAAMRSLGADLTVNGISYDFISLDDLTIQVAESPNKYTGIVTIPASITYKGKKLAVKGVGDRAFKNCHGLTSVSIAESIEYVGNESFAFCTRLGRVALPASLRSIGQSAFEGDTNLLDMRLPDGIAEIPGHCFMNCTRLTSLKLPANLEKIGHSAFSVCKSLASVTFGGRLAEIGSRAFESCHSLKSVTIPKNVNVVGDFAFGWCANLRTVIIEDSPEPIEMGNFKEYKSHHFVFQDCPVTTLYFGRDITEASRFELGNSFIDVCLHLKNLTIGPYITTLKSLNINYNDELRTIVCLAPQPPKVERFENAVYTDATLYLPADAIQLYKATPVWDKFWTIKPYTKQ